MLVHPIVCISDFQANKQTINKPQGMNHAYNVKVSADLTNLVIGQAPQIRRTRCDILKAQCFFVNSDVAKVIISHTKIWPNIASKQ